MANFEASSRLPRQAIGEIYFRITDLNTVIQTTDPEYDTGKILMGVDIIVTTAEGEGVESVQADHDAIFARMPAAIKQDVLSVIQWLRNEANSIQQLTPDS